MKDAKRKQVAVEIAEEKAYGKYDFQPKINNISKVIASARTIEDLTCQEEAEQRKEKLRKEMLDK